jgi:hypothetical protein
MHYKIKPYYFIKESYTQFTIFLKGVEEHEAQETCPYCIGTGTHYLYTKLFRRPSVEKSLIFVKNSDRYNRPYSTKAMHLRYIQRVINLIPADQFLSLHIDYTSYHPYDTSCPKSDLVAARRHADQPRKHPIAQLMYIVMVHGLPLIDLRVITKYIVVLVADRNHDAGASG